MLIDQRIHKHIDQIDGIENRLNAEIERIYSALDIEEIMATPEESLMQVSDEILNILKGDISVDAINSGINFAKEIKKAKEDFVIPDSTDADLHKELAND